MKNEYKITITGSGTKEDILDELQSFVEQFEWFCYEKESGVQNFGKFHAAWPALKLVIENEEHVVPPPIEEVDHGEGKVLCPACKGIRGETHPVTGRFVKCWKCWGKGIVEQ